MLSCIAANVVYVNDPEVGEIIPVRKNIILNVHKRMGFGRAGLCFWDEFQGRLPLLGKRLLAMGGPGCKNVSPCHL